MTTATAPPRTTLSTQYGTLAVTVNEYGWLTVNAARESGPITIDGIAYWLSTTLRRDAEGGWDFQRTATGHVHPGACYLARRDVLPDKRNGFAPPTAAAKEARRFVLECVATLAREYPGFMRTVALYAAEQELARCRLAVRACEHNLARALEAQDAAQDALSALTEE